MRELGLVADDTALDESFSDITALISQCRFSDCTHASEPGCTILAALASEGLSAERWQSYLKLQRELAFVARKDDPAAEAENRARWKQIHKSQRARYKHRSDHERE
jgi:ribosome biogenesis GTPase